MLGTKIYKAIDVARYIINYSNNQDYGISYLKLEKILYMVQAYFLIIKKMVCFEDKIVSLGYGPIVNDVNNEFRKFGSCDIPTIETYWVFEGYSGWDYKKLTFDDSIIEKEDKNLINKVVDKFKDYTATELLNIISRQKPYTEAHYEITPKSLMDYFNNTN